jgi:hypothetical protein
MHLLPLLLACTSQTDAPDDPSLDDTQAADDTQGTDDTDVGELSGAWTWDGGTVTVDAVVGQGGLRTYAMTSTHGMRDGGPNERSFTEHAGEPRLRSGNLLTDALFAMALEEARQNAVSEISDFAFEGAEACDCYQTGELWNWVWTRDIAYAVELGLAWVDPERAANSLLFKVSEPKGGGGLQIIQDTGTGGSWPVSTDRVAWARGAMAVLAVTDHPELEAAAIEAMRNTAETDRRYAFDARDGLYRGETSFLDWREQTYPGWTENGVVHIAMSKSLSTNLDHLFLLRSLEQLTGEDHDSDALAAAIDAAFWDGAAYRSYLTTELDPAPAQRQDLLATSFAVLDLGTHPEALAAYPTGPFGPPVIHPQQQFVPIYHNRGIWPFVTAYSVIAARTADNGAVLDAGMESLIRGAALNLSHMENFDFSTGANWVDEGATSGPVVNSRRQLWSVAGFLGAVGHGVFGVQAQGGVLSADPVLPQGDWFEDGATLVIGDLSATIDGATMDPGSATVLDVSDWTQVFGAQTPSVSLSGSGDSVSLDFAADADASFQVWADGQLLDGDATSPWSDTTSTTRCYAVVGELVHAGQPSEPQCWWGDGYVRTQSVGASGFTASGGTWSEDHGRGHYMDWGAPGHTLSAPITPNFTGEHLLQVTYGNGSGGVDSGVTAAVKWVEVWDGSGALIGEGPLVMPHRAGGWSDWGDSTFVPVSLQAGQSYTVTIRDGFNMSYLAHYETYLGRGGGAAPSNYVNISELKLLRMR